MRSITSPAVGRPRSREVAVTGSTLSVAAGSQHPSWSSRPPGCRHADVGDQHLAGAAFPLHRVRPLRADDEQGATIRAAEHAREAAAVGLHGLEDLAALGYSDTMLARHTGIPDGVLGIHTDAIRRGVLAECRPHPFTGQAPIRLDLVSGELTRVRLRDDKGLIVL